MPKLRVMVSLLSITLSTIVTGSETCSKSWYPCCLTRGVDINAETGEGRTALYFARACDDRPMVALLEQRGAKMDTKHRLASGALGAVDRLFKLF
jgi:ankyrin repeat protein